MEINGIDITASVTDIIAELKAQLEINGIHLFAKYFDNGGDDVMVCCPYHKEGRERRPSAGIRKSDGMFHCLACGETHSLPEMISHCFGWHDPFGKEGYRWLLKNFDTLEVNEREDIEIDLERNNSTNKNSLLADNSDNQLFRISEEELDSYRYTHPYMYERGLTDDIIDLFDIGYDEKTNSITFPVRYWGSMNFGKCMFVAKRRIDYKRFDLPSNFEKPLYGLYELWYLLTNAPLTDIEVYLGDEYVGKYTAGHVFGYNEIYVVEGLFDCLRLWCNGKPAVAGFGCNFSQYQLTLLRGLPTRTLILATDNDEAGQKARMKLRQALPTKLILDAKIPNGKKDIGECTDEEIQNMEIDV